MSVGASPYHIYKRTQVTTASQGELILLAYEGALKWLGVARAAMEEERPRLEEVHQALLRTQEIIAELQGALRLDVGGELATRLYQLYDFMQQQLMEANIHKDVEKMDAVASMLRELQEAWEQIIRGAPRTSEAEGNVETHASEAGQKVGSNASEASLRQTGADDEGSGDGQPTQASPLGMQGRLGGARSARPGRLGQVSRWPQAAPGAPLGRGLNVSG